MEIQTNYHKTQKTARYSTFGSLTPKTKYFWFALHGSNMVCEQMLYKFKDFDPDEHFVVAPEATSRFYAKHFEGDVVAAWMTKRDRLYEIGDIAEYLSTLYNKYVSQLPKGTQKIVFGFSQGGTMAYRWLHAKNENVDLLLAYSCWIPEDINLKETKTDLTRIKQIYTYGLQDQFLKEDKIEAINKLIQENNLEVELIPYQGDHRIDRQQLRIISESYLSLRI